MNRTRNTQLPATCIDWAKAKAAGALGKNHIAAARNALLIDITAYMKDQIRPQNVSAAPDANLAGQNQRELISVHGGESTALDFSYQALFREIDMRSSATGTYEMVDATVGLTFREILPGERMRTGSISSANQFIKALEFGAGLGILDIWLEDNELFRIEDAVQVAVKKWSRFVADAHYTLLAAIGAARNIAFDATIAQTIDNAANKIGNELGDKFGLSDSPSVYVLTAAPHAQKVSKALAARFDNPNNNNGQIQANIQSFMTTNNSKFAATYDFGAGAIPYAEVILAGEQMITLRKRDLGVEEAREAAIRGTDMYWSGRFNAAIGEAKQIVRIPLQ